MRLLWDASATLALIFEETFTADAAEAWEAAVESHAWRWMEVEAEAAVVRRRATDEQKQKLREVLAGFEWSSIPESEFPALCEFNRPLRLRSADAGHLFCCERLARAIPELTLVSFDDEMLAAARKLRLRIWKSTRRSRRP